MTDFGPLAGHTALVTGVGSAAGIGYATARLLARRGATVAVTASSPRAHDRGRELAAPAYVADLGDWNATERLVEEVATHIGWPDILVNSAGGRQDGTPPANVPFAQLEPKAWHRVLDANLTAAFHLCRLIAPGMASRGYGRIVTVSSVTGPHVSLPGVAAYSAAKAGVDGLTRALALEVAARGVTVNSVAPGFIDTAMMTVSDREAAARTPIGRPGTGDEVAELIAFLATPAASYITGQSLVIDGGNTVQEAKV
ncbi:SDR family NAD(P)-dependent oxidoreductase [Actinophytocola sp.]|uniref:SDR family NAD(P)-dependent oxidoreductase n=1 Tax=Actinophytocola sp. TaxID=1872138 RepID=UPI002ED3B1BA